MRDRGISSVSEPDRIEALLRGSVDMHVHTGPDALAPRRSNAFDVAKAARDAGMRGVVFKNKGTGTGTLAAVISELIPEVASIGALTLDSHVGGVNPAAVEIEARLGSKVIWMPTRDSANEMRAKGKPGPGLRVVDESGEVLPAVHDVFDLAVQYGLVVATGHVSREEVFALVRAAVVRGVKIVVTHPLTRSVGTAIPIEDHRALAELGAMIEHTFVATLPNHCLVPLEDFVASIHAVGAERCFVSSDFGQAHNPLPVEGFRLAIASLLRNGVSEREVELLVKKNPMRLLDLE